MAFINFEDIFLGLFDGDSADSLASALSRVAKLLEITILSNKTFPAT